MLAATTWAVPKQRYGAIETIIGFSLKQFSADAIEPVCGVKVRALLGPTQIGECRHIETDDKANLFSQPNHWGGFLEAQVLHIKLRLLDCLVMWTF